MVFMIVVLIPCVTSSFAVETQHSIPRSHKKKKSRDLFLAHILWAVNCL